MGRSRKRWADSDNDNDNDYSDNDNELVDPDLRPVGEVWDEHEPDGDELEGEEDGNVVVRALG